MNSEDNQIALFIHHLKYERQLSLHTLEHYQRDISDAYRFFSNQTHPFFWKNVDTDHVRQWITNERQQNKKSRSLNRKISALRTFFRFLIRQNKISCDPTDGISSLKTDNLLPKPLDVDEVFKLLEVEGDSFILTRDRAMLELIYSAGLRVSECVLLDLKSLDFSLMQVRILGKGKKERLGIIGQEAYSALQKWLKIRTVVLKDLEMQNAADSPHTSHTSHTSHTPHSSHASLASHDLYASHAPQAPLFVSNKGHRLTARSIQYRFAKLGIMQDISTHVHPHRLRHSFASHLLESSKNIRAVQELLGHKDLSSTQIYTALNFQHLAEVYDSSHPRAKLAHSSKAKGES